MNTDTNSNTPIPIDKEVSLNNILWYYEEIKMKLDSITRDERENIVNMFKEINLQKISAYQLNNMIKFLSNTDEDLRFEFLIHLSRTVEKNIISLFVSEFKSEYAKISKFGIDVKYKEPLLSKDICTYSNYQLVSSTSIVHEIYEGEFKKCISETDEEILSKPFKIKLVYGKGNGEDKLLNHQLLEGDFTEAELNELINSL